MRALLVAPVGTAATGNEATAARLCAVLAAADCDVHVIDADTASPEVLTLLLYCMHRGEITVVWARARCYDSIG